MIFTSQISPFLNPKVDQVNSQSEELLGLSSRATARVIVDSDDRDIQNIFDNIGFWIDTFIDSYYWKSLLLD